MGKQNKALIVGIDFYENHNNLNGCVNDAHSVKAAIERNGNGTVNFGVKIMTATGAEKPISKKELKDQAIELFRDDNEIALFYFAGHGHLENTGGYLATSEIDEGDEGLPMSELLQIANSSKARNKIIILDCCHSGLAGSLGNLDGKALLTEGLTILTASDSYQYASEKNGSGVFTNLLVDALNGGAADLLGRVTPGSIYAHIDQSLGPWKQRPIFKTNVKTFTVVKEVIQPTISLEDILKITEFFKEKGDAYELDPSYEPESESPKEEHTKIFAILQKYNRVNLVVPINAPHMFHAAIHSESCKLTLLGQHYWNLVKEELI